MMNREIPPRMTPNAQLRLSVDTLAELAAVDTSELRSADLCDVAELRGVAPKFSRHEGSWTHTVVFVPKQRATLSPDNDTVFAAPTGIWVRMRDVP